MALQSSNNSYLLCSFILFKVSFCGHILLFFLFSVSVPGGLLIVIKGTQKGKVTCYARERVNKNKLF